MSVRVSYLQRLTYDQGEHLYHTGHISSDEWDWLCWAISHTTTTLAQDLNGKPCPVHDQLYPCCVERAKHGQIDSSPVG
jgi:hypothetical protein